MSRKWNKEELETLELLYPHLPNREVAGIIGKTKAAVEQKAHVCNVKKSESYMIRLAKEMKEVNKATQFKKGHITWNKGTKGLTSANSGSFKKGQKSHNKRPLGSTRITQDGYTEVKTKEPSTWELLHRLEWQKHNGAIPDGHNVQFKNGNKQDCKIENLYLIDKAGNMLKNTIQRYPDELKRVIRRKAKLKRIIKNMETQGNE